MKGAAWAAPAVLATATVPVYAASNELAKGLQGGLPIGKRCNSGGTNVMCIDGTRPAYPTGGLWVGGVSAKDQVTSAKLTLYLPVSMGVITWTAVTSTTITAWTLPAIDSTVPQRAGYYAYSFVYRGSWTYNATDKTYLAAVAPNFTANLPTYTMCSTRSDAYLRREVVVNGKSYLLERGPLSL